MLLRVLTAIFSFKYNAGIAFNSLTLTCVRVKVTLARFRDVMASSLNARLQLILIALKQQ